jgi:hypothetical protein
MEGDEAGAKVLPVTFQATSQSVCPQGSGEKAGFLLRDSNKT